LDQPVYRITEFARKTSVSVRTLRYYDKIGLLVPSLYDESGFKLYTDKDFISLQSILSFKFLGFSLKEIQILLSGDKQGLQNKLAKQKAMMEDKRVQINQIIQAIERAERSLESNSFHYQSITDLIQVTQMDLKPEWVNKYLTTQDRTTMRELAKQSYSKEALKRLAERGWTEEDHRNHHSDYQFFRTSLTRLVNDGCTADSQEAQDLAEFLTDMNKRYSQNDPQIKEGMKQSWEKFNSLPEDKKPKAYTIPDSEREFIMQACLIYHQNKFSEKP
jgi:DNA-binding transcriptional MerR regulator